MNEKEQKQQDRSDIQIAFLFAKLLKLAKKKYRTKKDFAEIDEIERRFEATVHDI